MSQFADSKPFQLQQGEEAIAEEKAQSLILNVRLNAREQAMLLEAKRFMNMHMDSTAFKTLAWAGFNVLHGTLTPELLRYLTDPARRRDTIEERIGKPRGLKL